MSIPLQVLVSAVALGALIVPVSATPADYCAAYARDFADAGPRDEGRWQRRYDNSNAACLFQYQRTVAAVPPKPKVVAVKPVAKLPVAKPPEEETVQVATAIVEAKTSGAKPRLEEGSDAWLDYCDTKYASFDRAKGTYLSRTGIERKCLVTAN